ncbi:MAG: helix-turn-helix transcriptional regulator [Pseudomonadota bacterium]
MAEDALIGTRIRERRQIVGLRQAELARRVGISASYLNLIEHNRRGIGGKLLINIAGVLEVDVPALRQGAEAELLATLSEVAERIAVPAEDASRVQEFAGRFPAWADALARTHRRAAQLERQVETLNDRLSHDPELAASVHEVLSTAASIRSTAAILASDSEIDSHWRERFHRNIDSDSVRLSDSSKALVRFLDPETKAPDLLAAPQEEVEAFLAAHSYRFETLEDGTGTAEEIIAGSFLLVSDVARDRVRALLDQVVRDIARVPSARLEDAIAAHGEVPIALAVGLDVDVPTILRRLAARADTRLGLVLIDTEHGMTVARAGLAQIRRRALTGAALGMICRAQAAPGQVVTACLNEGTAGTDPLYAVACAAPATVTAADQPPERHASLLIRSGAPF